MSFLNSVLNSIGSKSSPPAVAPSTNSARSLPPRPEAAGDRYPSLGDQNKALPGKKRAAEETIEQPKGKILKTGNVAPSAVRTSSSQPAVSRDKAPATPNVNPSAAKAGSGRPALTSRPSSTSKSPLAAPSNANDEAPLKKEPKKGSYAEIMARAKANQANVVAVGGISHKAKEKGALTHKQELKIQKRAKLDKRMGVARDKDTSRSASAEENPKNKKPGSKGGKPPPMARVKKVRPQPTYKGTMNPASETMKAKEKAAAQTRRRDNQYAGTDDELDEEDEVEEGDDDCFDEESDDMEAGFSDVEEEESRAAKVAKKEDEEEARLEAKSKREKEERKRNMEALAKKAKPQRY